MSTTPYRQLWLVSDNIPEGKRYSGMFAISATTGAPGALVRPSAGSNAAAGAGNLFTVTQPAANTFQWLVTMTELCMKPIWTTAELLLVPGTAGTSGSPPTAPSSAVLNVTTSNAVAMSTTQIDAGSVTANPYVAGSNSFWITMSDAVTGAILTSTNHPTVPGSYTLQIGFEIESIPTVVPATL